jgi:hypothetical protein
MFTGLLSEGPEWTLDAVAKALGKWVGAAARATRQFICGVRGHSPLLCHRPDRVCLRCPCGYESPGWRIGTRVVQAQRPAGLTRTPAPPRLVAVRRAV